MLLPATAGAARFRRRQSVPAAELIERKGPVARPHGVRPIPQMVHPAIGGHSRPPTTELLWAKPQAVPATPSIEPSEASAIKGGETQSVITHHPPPPPAAAAPALDMNRLVEEVLHRLERQARSERLRRGR